MVKQMFRVRTDTTAWMTNTTLGGAIRTVNAIVSKNASEYPLLRIEESTDGGESWVQLLWYITKAKKWKARI